MGILMFALSAMRANAEGGLVAGMDEGVRCIEVGSTFELCLRRIEEPRSPDSVWRTDAEALLREVVSNLEERRRLTPTVQTALCRADACSANTTFDVSDRDYVASATLSLAVGGDLGDSWESVTIMINDKVIGTCDDFSSDCSLEPCLSTLDVTEEAATGRIDLAIQASSDVDNSCDYGGFADVAVFAEATLAVARSDTVRPSPSPTLSVEPTSAPSPRSIYGCVEAQASVSYSSIATEVGASLLSLSLYDDRTESVSLPFAFPWFSTTVTNITVSSNGQLNMDGRADDNCCSADPIAPNSYYGDRVAFAQQDLDPPFGGGIYVLDKASSFVISFEGVPFYWNYGSDVANVQVELFESGQIELRWGSGATIHNSFAAGVQSDADLVYVPVATAGETTFVNGVTDTWPTNDGVRFVCGIEEELTQPPSSQPTGSLAPTTSVSPTPSLSPRTMVRSVFCRASGCSFNITFDDAILGQDLHFIESASLSLLVGGDLGDFGESLTVKINDNAVERYDDFNGDCKDPEPCLSNLDVTGEAATGRVDLTIEASTLVDNLCNYSGFTDVAMFAEATLTIELAETARPSPFPTVTFEPTMFAGSLYACIETHPTASYRSIATEAGVAVLEISSDNDKTGLVNLPFAFPWFGELLTSITVSTNGQLNMDGSCYDMCCSPLPILEPWYWNYYYDAYYYADYQYDHSYYGVERVAFAQEDLDPSQGGTIYALDKASSIVISFESVPFFSHSPPSSAITNVQVELFESGQIELRWGPGDSGNHSFAAGVQSDAESVYAPVVTAGEAVFVDGIADTWPANAAVHFVCGIRAELSGVPSSQPTATLSPTSGEQPTFLPTQCTPGKYTDKDGCVICSAGTYSETGQTDRCTDPCRTPR